MFVSAVRLVNFRSYRDATVALQPGLNIVAGENATGKTNLLEGAFFALRAASPRTRREDKLITWGEVFTRVDVRLTEHAESRKTLLRLWSHGATHYLVVDETDSKSSP